MKKLITICLLIATAFTVNVQNIKNYKGQLKKTTKLFINCNLAIVLLLVSVK